jgi:erythromycin esterase
VNEDNPESDQSPSIEVLNEEEQLLLQELEQWLIPLQSPPLELTDGDLSFVDQWIGAAIVGLGEATHGTREFFQMKHRLFRYLVEHCGHKAIIFEADFAESIYLDKYVTTGEGNLKELMMDKMHFWIWKNEEVMELLEWMKNYNTGKPDLEKIHYFGNDCQYTTYQPVLLREYLQGTLPALWESAAPLIEQVETMTADDYKAMSDTAFQDIGMQFTSLEDQFVTNRDPLISNSSAWEYEINKQLLRNLYQSFVKRYQYYHRITSDWRDQCMAENSLWTVRLFGPEAKITLWAHNSHITKGWTAAMGEFLNEEIGGLYQPIGFSFSRGSFTAKPGSSKNPTTMYINEIPMVHSYNIVFHEASHPNFAFQLDVIPDDSHWASWMEVKREFLMNIGAVFSGFADFYYSRIDIREHFDWIIHFDETEASTPIQ